MKTSIYFNYTTRSLFRGGQRTLLAIFCVAVGVMAIVSLQLVGLMIQNSFTSNVRDTNGGDIAVTAQISSFTQNDLAFFAQLKNNGTISNYTAVESQSGALNATSSRPETFDILAVDPKNYPVVTSPTFVTPTNGSVSALLTNNQVIVTQKFLDTYYKKVGDSFDVFIKSSTGSGQTLHLKLAGVVANSGVFAQSGSAMLVSLSDYQAQTPGTTISYSLVDLTTTSQSHTDAAVKTIEKQFPLVNVQTAADALRSQQSSVDNINQFLKITGLLALLIGGVGIVNTMQVLLSRRKTEIAMLKTTGYRRSDLYLLFGLEAGLLGLIGGVIGAASAIGVSYIVRNLMQNVGFNVPFQLDAVTILGGIAIGLVTALIFGLMPIVQAANTRPLNVIREQSGKNSLSSLALSIGLLLLLSVLFCVLAIVILNNNILLGISAVYGTFLFLLLLSSFFGLVVLAVSKLPVPERFNIQHLALVLLGIVLGAIVYVNLPVFGAILLGASLLGLFIVFFPRTWKASTKMALRNIGRQRTRTTTTMLALFIGVFTIGLVLALGQDLKDQINNSFAQNLTYNVVVTTSGADTAKLQSNLGTVPGLTKTRSDAYVKVVPQQFNGQPVQDQLPQGDNRMIVLSSLSSIEGYQLTQNVPNVTIAQGRNLNASDAGTNNVVVSWTLTNTGPFQMHLKVGDTITFASADGKSVKTETIVGVYARSTSIDHLGNVLASADTAKALNSVTTDPTTVVYMKVDAAQVNKAVTAVGKLVPDATVQNLGDIGSYIEQLLNNILSMLVAIASLSVIAAVIIIANAVALAMLERRRELGILKSVGYTSRSVLSAVLIENGVVSGIGAMIAMLLATLAISILGTLLFKASFSIQSLIILSVIGSSALLAMLVAALVAWGSVRVRPLEVLRYE